MSQPETRFKEKVQRRLKQVPELYCRKIQQQSIRGMPDLLIIYCGLAFTWELKTSTGRATRLQTYELDAISKAGGIARVVTPDNFEECLAELLAFYKPISYTKFK
jgi:hypothetical protein